MTPEQLACIPVPLQRDNFNPAAELPYGCTVDAIYSAMKEFQDFLHFINTQLATRQIERLESMLMPANFSSIVGEFISAAIPRHCATLVKNQHHNGHPDLIPTGMFPNNAAQHASKGIEVKASRYSSGWQGHNPEEIWLMVFVFDSNRPSDTSKGIAPRPFRFIKVVGAQLELGDWSYSGRSEQSRRTITASVTNSGYIKMEANWIYRASSS